MGSRRWSYLWLSDTSGRSRWWAQSMRTITASTCPLSLLTLQKLTAYVLCQNNTIPLAGWECSNSFALTAGDRIEMGWLCCLPLGAGLTGWASSSSKDRKRGVSGGVNSLFHNRNPSFNNNNQWNSWKNTDAQKKMTNKKNKARVSLQLNHLFKF